MKPTIIVDLMMLFFSYLCTVIGIYPVFEVMETNT